MAHLTQKRLEQAREILNRYREQLLSRHSCNIQALETELKVLWGLSYGELKGIIIELTRTPEYELLAARYMEEADSLCVASEFKAPLARLYKIRAYDSAERESMKKLYWDEAFATRDSNVPT